MGENCFLSREKIKIGKIVILNDLGQAIMIFKYISVITLLMEKKIVNCIDMNIMHIIKNNFLKEPRVYFHLASNIYIYIMCVCMYLIL